MTQHMPPAREKFPSTALLKRWIGPAVALGIAGGCLAGAIWYRMDVPVILSAAPPPATVTQTIIPAPQIVPDVREVKQVVTTTVERPVPAAAPPAATVTVTQRAQPELLQVEQPVRREKVKPETVTRTETTTVEVKANSGPGNNGNGPG